MNPAPQPDPPDERAWWKQATDRRLDDIEDRQAANEKSLGAEINTNIRRDEQLNGEFGLIVTMRANTAAIKANTEAIESDRKAAAAERERAAKEREQIRRERAQFMWRTALSLMISLLLIVATIVISGALS